MKKITDYALEEVIVVTRQTIDALLNEEDSAELIAMYITYCHTTTFGKFTENGPNPLGWPDEKVKKYRQRLIDIGLIEVYQNKLQWQVRVNYLTRPPLTKDKNKLQVIKKSNEGD